MNGDLKKAAEELIKLEIESANAYNEVSKLAVNDLDKLLLKSLSLNNTEHANNLIALYKYVFNADFYRNIPQQQISNSYINELKNLYNAELIKYYLYDSQLKLGIGYPLNDAYFRGKTDANNHVVLLQNLLEKLQK